MPDGDTAARAGIPDSGTNTAPVPEQNRYACVVWLKGFIRQLLWWITSFPSMAAVMFSSGLSGITGIVPDVPQP